jgi:two-component system phosphate regulon sensor histidine kinase PhoR
VPVEGHALRLAVPLSEVGQQVQAIRRRMLMAVALAFLPAVLLAAIFARHVSGRLGRIIQYATELAQGNYRARLQHSGKGELGILGRKLNETGEQLERKQTKLERVERIRKDFVMNVSHELRTPLASIQGYTETLLDGALDDPENNVRFLSIIRQNAERLARLSADLITLSQIELQTRVFRFGFRDVNKLLGELVDSMRPIAQKKNIAITLEPASDGAQVYCDGEATFQVLANLLDNAVKYTAEGGSITVGARKTAGAMEIWVRDTGIGIPPEDLPRLFERFYRVDKARSRELGGTGLGLAIVKHLVQAQGGEVRVESQPGKGSAFAFTLPTSEREVAESAELDEELTAL